MTHHEFGCSIQDLPDLGVGCALAKEEVSLSLPDHLLQVGRLFLVDPNPNVGRVDLQS